MSNQVTDPEYEKLKKEIDELRKEISELKDLGIRFKQEIEENAIRLFNIISYPNEKDINNGTRFYGGGIHCESYRKWASILLKHYTYKGDIL